MMNIHADFAGGNALLESIESDHVKLRQDQRGSVTPWFFWRFAVEGAADRTLTFEFTDWNIIGTQGPAISRDGGQTWEWLGRDCVKGPSFTYQFRQDEQNVQFCFCIPYLQAQLDEFLETHPVIKRSVLCHSRQGREVERLDVGKTDAPWVLVCCRHHACESSASHVLEGFLHAWSQDTPSGARLTAIPFVDKDGVENGDQGKDRDGRDHNRDYDDAPRYPETADLMQLIRENGPPDIYLDIHAPWIRGEWNDRIYLVGDSNPQTAERQRALLNLVVDFQKGPLPIRPDDFLPYGQAWNTSMTAHSTGWQQQMGAWLSTTVEVPYADVHGVPVTVDNLRLFGQGAAIAIRKMLALRADI